MVAWRVSVLGTGTGVDLSLLGSAGNSSSRNHTASFALPMLRLRGGASASAVMVVEKLAATVIAEFPVLKRPDKF